MKSPLLIALVLIATPFLQAQHNNRSARDLQFRFSNPGARSLGFGGAFIGLADDATAPVANPAGMSRTGKRSLSLELNYTRTQNEIPFHGGEILQTNIFEFEYNLETASAPESKFQAPYLAAVFPAGNWRYGFFAHRQANLEREYTTQAIVVCHLMANGHPNCDHDNPDLAFNPSTDVLDLDIVNYGGTFSYGFGERFSIGASIFYSDMSYRADSVIDFETVLDVVRVEKLAGGSDQDWGAIVGMIWQIAPELSAGAVYKRQAEFKYTAQLRSERPLAGVPGDFVRNGLFKIPDSLGLGISISPLEHVTINVDANRVYYSQITDNLIDFAEVRSGNSLITQAMPDVTEIHLGLEWVFTGGARPISARVGYWRDPYHAATNNVQDSQILEGDIERPSVRDVFFLHLFENDEDHYSLGLGWTFGSDLQFDAAYQYSDGSREATVSGVYRF